MLPSIEYIKTLVNGLKQWVENRVKSVRKELTDKVEDLPQADWDQNDPEAKDYVKNRPCYTATELCSTTFASALMYPDRPVVAVSFDENEKLKIVSVEGSQPWTYILENGDQFAVRYNSGTGFYVSNKPEGVDTIYFWYEASVVYPLLDDYIPDWVANKNTDLVQANYTESDKDSKSYIKNKPDTLVVTYQNYTDRNYFDLYTTFDKFPERRLWIINLKNANTRSKIKYIYGTNSTGTYNLLSCRTRKIVEDWEQPYGFVVIARWTGTDDNFYLMNPLTKDRFDKDEALPQHVMESDPVENMQIATKSYVDSQKFSGSYNDLTDRPGGYIECSEVLSKTFAASDFQSAGDNLYQATFTPNQVFAVGNAYNVTCNGTKYEDLVAEELDGGILIGEIGDSAPGFTNYPFCIYVKPDGTNLIYQQSASAMTVLVEEQTAIKIPAKYLPDLPTVTPFSIDSTASDYSITDTTYGDHVKTALLAGRDVWYIGTETDESGKTVTKYTKVSWFNIEKTDTEAKLIVGVGARTDDNSGAVTFAISV